MNALLLDFMRRWWWVLLGGVLVSVATVLGGMPVIAAPLGAVLLLIDAQFGGMRVLRCLPVRTAEQGFFCWIVVVLLVPVLSMAAMLPTALLRDLFLPPDPHIWFRLAVHGWVALGYSAAAYILIVFLPTRPGENARDNLAGSIAGALWGISVAGFIFIFPNMPRTPGAIFGWQWVIFAGVPLLFCASFALRQEFLLRRSVSSSSSSSATPRRGSEQPWRSAPRGLTGVPLFLARVPTQAIAITFMVFLFQLIFLSLFLRDKGGNLWDLASTGAIQTAAMGVMFASLTAMWVNIRSLRVLPISSRALAALLLSPALGVGTLTGVFAALSRWAGSSRPLPLQAWDIGLLVFGFAAVGLAIMIRHPKVGIFLVIGMISAATPLVMFLATRPYNLSLGASVLGGALAIVGYLFIVHTLKSASGIYRRPAIFGLGGYSQQGR